MPSMRCLLGCATQFIMSWCDMVLPGSCVMYVLAYQAATAVTLGCAVVANEESGMRQVGSYMGHATTWNCMHL